MALLMKQGDYAADGNGGVAAAQGGDELICEVLFRLTARRGSFPFLPGLGSRMGRLRREKPSVQGGPGPVHPAVLPPGAAGQPGPAVRRGGAGGYGRTDRDRRVGAPGG